VDFPTRKSSRKSKNIQRRRIFDVNFCSLKVLINPIFLPIPNRAKNDRITMDYPLVNIQKAMENGPVEIVDFPMKNGGSVDFPIKNGDFPLLC